MNASLYILKQEFIKSLIFQEKLIAIYDFSKYDLICTCYIHPIINE